MPQITWIEALGAITGLISVWLTVRNNVWCWAWGIASVLLYGAIFFREKLYADMALQLVFCGMNAYGWYEWLHGGDSHKERVITRLPKSIIPFSAVATLLFAIGSALFLRRFTDATLPEMDALLTSMSLCAVWMQARKYCESWLVWLCADVLYVGMFISKALWLTAALYLVFVVMAWIGYREWSSIIRKTSFASEGASIL
jgi:nicotinamide mononucleotide transporter